MWKAFAGVVVGCALTDYVLKNYDIESEFTSTKFSIKVTKKTAAAV
jgi:hypothetical protein